MAQLTALGIDVSKADFHVCLLLETIRKHKRFQNSKAGFERLHDWLSTHGQECVHACMESTGPYSEPLAEYLADQGHHVSLVNPKRIKAYGESDLIRAKTDKADADLIARFCREKRPDPWSPLPPKQRLLRDWVRRLENLTEMRQMELNRLEGATGPVAEHINDHVEELTKQMDATKKRIRELIDDDPDMRKRRNLLQTIPGIGEATIAVILAEFGDITRFTSAKALAAWVGLSPRLVQSGKYRGRTMICRTSRGKLRKAFYMPALVAIRYNAPIMQMHERLLAAYKPKKAIVAAAMRKQVHIIYGVLKSGTPFEAKKAASGVAN